MSFDWKAQSKRFMALPRRERALLPGAICFAILMLGHLLLIEPARKQLALLKAQHSQESSDLVTVQSQLTILRTKLQDPDAAARSQLEGLRTQARSTDEQLKLLQQSLVPAQEMSQWLGGLLQAQRGLQLMGLKSLPVASVSDLVAAKAAPQAAAQPAAAPAEGASQPRAAQEAWLYRHGVEITLRGNYHDLVAYLHTLEHLPRRVYWGELRVNAQDSPAVVMTLTVYTISLEKAWWVI